MTQNWKQIENQTTKEGYKAYRMKKQNLDFDYQDFVLATFEENPFLAAQLARFLEPFNTKLETIILSKSAQILHSTKKGEKFVWAAHVFEYYDKIDILNDILTVSKTQHHRLKMMQNLENWKPLDYFYNILIDYVEDENAKKLLIEIAEDRGVFIGEVYYSTLINKAQTFTEAKFVFDQMLKKNIKPNEISYNTLINKSESFADAKFFFQEMKNANLRPNEISYSTLINKAQTFEQQKPFYLDFLKLFPLKKGNFKTEKNYNFLFTALFKKVRNKEHFAFVQSEIYRLGLKMDNYTQSFYNTLQKKYS